MWRLTIAVALLGLVMTSCASANVDERIASTSEPPTSTTAPPQTTIPPCPPSGVQVTVGDVDASMGLRVMGVRLTNCSTQTYTVTGYPEVTLLDEDQQPFDVQVLHGAEPITSNQGFCTPTGQFDAGPQPVTLAPGEQAFSSLVWRNLTTDELDRLVNATSLLVAPAAGDTPQELDPSGGIDLGTTGRLGVSAWQPAHTGCS